MFQIKNYKTNILDKKKLISFEYLFFLILIFFVFRSFEYLIYWYEAYQKAFYGNADHIFWDFEVYKCAADFFINNENPYKLTTDCSPSNKPFIFNYPPFTILIFLPFTLFGFTIAKTIWGLLLILLFINFLNLQKKLFNIKINYFIYSLIVIFSLDKTLIYSFFTGNMSFVLQILLACSFYFLSINKTKTFFFIISFISIFKFYFLIFLLCPILLSKFKYLKEIIITLSLVSLFYIANYFFDPVYFSNWLLNIYKISIGKNYDSVGIGSLNYIILLLNFLENKNILNLNSNREFVELFLTFFYLILIFFIGYYFLNKNNLKNKKIKLALSILIIGLSIPRLAIYELIIFIIPIIFLFENFYNSINKRKSQLFIAFIFLSIFLLNGDSGVTYPFLLVFTLSNLFLYKNNSKIT